MVWAMSLEALARLLTLDFSWFVNLIANNLVWLFIFIAAGLFLYPKKKMVISFLVITFILWGAIDFTRAIGWVLLDARYLAFNTFVQMAVLFFVEADENLKKHFLFINTLRFLFVLSIFNLFLR